MTIRVSPERSTLSLLSSRLRSEESRAPAQPSNISDQRPAAAAAAPRKSVDAAQLRADGALLDRASSIADTALAATATISSLLEQLRDLAAGAREPGADKGAEFRNLGALIAQTVKDAAFDGVNLLDGSQVGAFRVPVGGEGSGDLALSAFDLTPGGAELTVTGDADPALALQAVEASLDNTAHVRVRLSDDSKRVDAHRSFVSMLSDALGGGGSLDVEGARLAALQLRQSLGGEGFSIANQAPQTVLALFR